MAVCKHFRFISKQPQIHKQTSHTSFFNNIMSAALSLIIDKTNQNARKFIRLNIYIYYNTFNQEHACTQLMRVVELIAGLTRIAVSVVASDLTEMLRSFDN